MPAEDEFIPNYYRIEKHLRDRIRCGDLKPGDPIPPNRSSSSSSASAA